jgi:L-arabinokinase
MTRTENVAQPDIDRVLSMVNANAIVDDAGAPYFATDREIVIARAPGRLDLMGGIADYSGALVLQWPIAEAMVAAAQVVDTGEIEIVSVSDEATRRFTMPISDLFANGAPIEYGEAAAYFRRDPDHHWAAYAAGTLLTLLKLEPSPLAPLPNSHVPRLGQGNSSVARGEGLRLLLVSNVPEGKGVSSSAAIEVASMIAIAAALGIDIEPRKLALLCQTTENLVAGAPCGVMDQMTSAVGMEGQLLALLCQPAEVQGNVRIPDALEVLGIDSGIRHAVSGNDYGAVRTAAAMGQWIMQAHGGVDAVPGGHLANVEPSLFESRYAPLVPDLMRGGEFLSIHGDVLAPPAHVRPDALYPVRAATAHPIHEHHRVRLYRRLLESYGSGSDEAACLLGELMYQSHASYSRCGLGSSGTDRLVDIVREFGPDRGVYGAKITGGGSGGTVAILAARGSESVIREIAEAYARESGYAPYLFSGTSPGAAEFGVARAHHHGTEWRIAR